MKLFATAEGLVHPRRRQPGPHRRRERGEPGSPADNGHHDRSEEGGESAQLNSAEPDWNEARFRPPKFH